VFQAVEKSKPHGKAKPVALLGEKRKVSFNIITQETSFLEAI
jgi:hypothetical protein